jgi:hypothetical protein
MLPIDPDPATIERMARALCIAQCPGPDLWYEIPNDVRGAYRRCALAAYAALVTPAEGERTCP